MLIPGRRKPVDGDGSGQGAAIHEAEESWARDRERGRPRDPIELLDDFLGWDRAVLQLDVELRESCHCFARWSNPSFADGRQITLRALGDVVQDGPRGIKVGRCLHRPFRIVSHK